MADPLSIAAGIVGLVAPALHVSRLWLHDLQQIQDAKENEKTLTHNIGSLTMALTSVKAIDDKEWNSLGPVVADNAKWAIALFTAACERFKSDLQGWTSRSEDGKLSWIEQSKIGFWKRAHIKSVNGKIEASASGGVFVKCPGICSSSVKPRANPPRPEGRLKLVQSR
ncbi:uncharacterized protein N7482_005662 [Penicillium canariense]|uniref:Azaphilone pigments biosynthesis cluster protein L N-terminal domain-containing protein n=1 Tax=Penicillium canariense TaxID=189055 RepID=A0A9W9I2Z6_9EURO|nr:uncharacterized protein N7482_005662 [Penicillium canariense]KAJ5166881.1 hypothetical protein N7482_005662 [Penicillium canariense]